MIIPKPIADCDHNKNAADCGMNASNESWMGKASKMHDTKQACQPLKMHESGMHDSNQRCMTKHDMPSRKVMHDSSHANFRTDQIVKTHIFLKNNQN